MVFYIKHLGYLVGTLVLDKKGGITHILWLFGIPFVLGYFQYIGVSVEAGIPYDLAIKHYFFLHSPMFVLHIYNLLLYFGIYAICIKIRTKRDQQSRESAELDYFKVKGLINSEE